MKIWRFAVPAAIPQKKKGRTPFFKIIIYIFICQAFSSYTSNIRIQKPPPRQHSQKPRYFLPKKKISFLLIRKSFSQLFFCIAQKMFIYYSRIAFRKYLVAYFISILVPRNKSFFFLCTIFHKISPSKRLYSHHNIIVFKSQLN